MIIYFCDVEVNYLPNHFQVIQYLQNYLAYNFHNAIVDYRSLAGWQPHMPVEHGDSNRQMS